MDEFALRLAYAIWCIFGLGGGLLVGIITLCWWLGLIIFLVGGLVAFIVYRSV